MLRLLFAVLLPVGLLLGTTGCTGGRTRRKADQAPTLHTALAQGEYQLRAVHLRKELYCRFPNSFDCRLGERSRLALVKVLPGTCWQTQGPNPTVLAYLDTTLWRTDTVGGRARSGTDGSSVCCQNSDRACMGQVFALTCLSSLGPDSADLAFTLQPYNHPQQVLLHEFAAFVHGRNWPATALQDALWCLFAGMPLEYLELPTRADTELLRRWIGTKTRTPAPPWAAHQFFEYAAGTTGTLRFWLPRPATTSIWLHSATAGPTTLAPPVLWPLATDTLLPAGPHAFRFEIPRDVTVPPDAVFTLVAEGWHLRTWPLRSR
jgi:hypothetical protein